MKTIAVLSTKDYEQFKTLPGNRAINKSHVNKLIKSVENRDYTQYQPILVTKDLYIIDGQHRVEALKALKRDVFYTILPNATLETIQALNDNVKAWSIRDFCISHSEKGNDDYAQLLEFADANGLSISLAANLLSKVVTEDGNIAKSVRNGSFRIWNRANAEEMVRRLKGMEPFIVGGAWKTRSFIKAMVLLYKKGMEHNLLLNHFQATGKRIYRQIDSRGYMIELLDIYNHGLKSKTKRINLF